MGGRGASSSIETARQRVVSLYAERISAQRQVTRANNNLIRAEASADLYDGNRASREYARILNSRDKAREAANKARDKYDKINREFTKADDRYRKLTARASEEDVPLF